MASTRRPTVVLFGAGMVARIHADACRALEWRVAAVASRSGDRAAALAREIGARAITYDDAIGAPLGDLAVVATPPGDHVRAAIALLDAGYQVVVEAPIACTLAQADALVEAEARVGRPVLYSEHLVSSPAVDALLARVPAIGSLTHLSTRALRSPPSWRPSDEPSWGGGALFDLGVHPVGLALRTAAEAGAGAPVSLTAVIVDAGTDHEHATVKVRFESGLRATIVVGWQPGAAPDADLQASSAGAVLRVDLHPSPSLEQSGVPVALGPPVRVGTPNLVEDYGYAPQLKRFWTNIRTGRPVPATSRFGRQVLDVIAAAHWSAGRDAVEVAIPFPGPRDRSPSELFET
jgi:predicted dehydrogenase